MQPPKKFYTWDDVQRMCADICQQIALDGWRPDYVVGITRGGNIPATLISHYLNVRCEALKIKMRDLEPDEDGTCSDCGMAEDAYDGKKILVVDDINDTGETFNWLINDWPAGCHPSDDRWNTTWDNNVRFATLTENLASKFEHVRYHADEVNKTEQNVWLVYPWETWWK